MLTGQIVYCVVDADRVCSWPYDERREAIEHLDGVESDVRVRLRLVTLQVMSVEPGDGDERAKRDTDPAPAMAFCEEAADG